MNKREAKKQCRSALFGWMLASANEYDLSALIGEFNDLSVDDQERLLTAWGELMEEVGR